jgi:hypothetical protein
MHPYKRQNTEIRKHHKKGGNCQECLNNNFSKISSTLSSWSQISPYDRLLGCALQFHNFELAKLPKATISFFMSFCQHGRTQFSLDTFPLTFIGYDFFSKISPENASLITIRPDSGTARAWEPMYSYSCNMAMYYSLNETKFVHKFEADFMFNKLVFVFENHAFMS